MTFRGPFWPKIPCLTGRGWQVNIRGGDSSGLLPASLLQPCCSQVGAGSPENERVTCSAVRQYNRAELPRALSYFLAICEREEGRQALGCDSDVAISTGGHPTSCPQVRKDSSSGGLEICLRLELFIPSSVSH